MPGTNVFKVTITWDDPNDAQLIANGIAQVFIEENQRLQQSQTAAVGTSQIKQSLAYYEAQVRSLRQERDPLVASDLLPVEKSTALKRVEDRLLPLEDVYRRYLTEAASTEQTQASRLHSAVIMDRAPLGLAIGPNMAQNLALGGAVSLVFSLALIVLLEYLDYTVKTPEELTQLTGAAPLGVIGNILMDGRNQRRRRMRREDAATNPAEGPPTVDGAGTNTDRSDPTLVTLVHRRAPISEAYRVLRTNIQFGALDKPVKSVVVTSAVPLEGKTLTLANLAITFAQAGVPVILVDSDLRRPSIHRLFRLPNAEGFTSLVMREPVTREALEATLKPPGVEGLRILTSGQLPPNPSELLMTQRASALIDQLKEAADMVFFDSPPIGPLTDASIIARKVDGVLLVVQAGKTRRELVTNAMNTLKATEARLLGTVLNRVKGSELGSYSYYYYYYSGDSSRKARTDTARS